MGAVDPEKIYYRASRATLPAQPRHCLPHPVFQAGIILARAAQHVGRQAITRQALPAIMTRAAIATYPVFHGLPGRNLQHRQTLAYPLHAASSHTCSTKTPAGNLCAASLLIAA
ncbi:MAG TPA: hypothetical protein DCM00_04835, partial [Alcanivorax sp.]|nr:hypothetical protein [Alcanivorax sp.]